MPVVCILICMVCMTEGRTEIVNNRKKVRRLIFCSGKVYYDLLEYHEEKGVKVRAWE